MPGISRVYLTDYLVGGQVGGVVKNILAMATGVVDGLGLALGLNARAAPILTYTHFYVTKECQKSIRYTLAN